MEKQYYKEYYKLEQQHWWFRARLNILETLIQKRIDKHKPLKILNAGAATGATSVMLKKFGDVKSLEYDKDCAEFLSNILNEKVYNNSLTELPFDDETFDLVCAFDVIEHIEDDNQALSEINRVLKKNGQVFITVPAFKELWSNHDEINHHFRRYRLKGLSEIIKKNGLELNYGSYFNSLLFTPIFIIRLLSKLMPSNKDRTSTGSDFEKFKLNGFLNKVLYRVFRSEIYFLNKSVTIPFGVSALVIANKPVK